MLAASAAFKARAVQSHHRQIKLQQLDSNLQVIQELTPRVLGGQVQLSANQEGRRTLTLSLANPKGVYTPSQASDPFWFNATLRVQYGVILANGTTEYITIGTFLVNQARAIISGAERSINVSAVDFWKKFQTYSLTSVAKYAAGSSLKAAIIDLATRAGVINYSIDPTLNTYTFHAAPSADLQLARGTPLADAMGILASDYFLDFWFDEFGVFQVRAYIDFNTMSPIFTLTDQDAGIIKIEPELVDSPDIKNHIGVSSTNLDIQPVFQEAKDNNTSSPTYVLGPFGDRYFEYSADWIQNATQASDTAKGILKRKLFFARQLNIESVPMPWLDGFDVGLCTAAEAKVTSAKYYLDSASIPLALGSQQTKLLEVRPLP